MRKILTSAAFKRFALFCLAAVLILAVVLTVKTSRSAPVLAVYAGILPAADCAGLKTGITLYKDSSYKLEETYLDTRDGDKYFCSKGKWEMVINRGRNIIRLHMKKSEQDYCFLVVDSLHIKPIGNDLDETNVPFDTRLIRIK